MGIVAKSQTTQTCLVMWLNDGGKTMFAFSEKPKITFDGESLVLKTKKIEVKYPLSEIKNFTFSDVSTSVESLQVTSDAKDNGIVSIYNISGQLIESFEVKNNKQLTFITEHLPKGIYIIKTISHTFKLIKP